MTCPHCRRETPELSFCTFCGADLSGSGHRAARRTGSFAAHPHERLMVPEVFSTLLPHLEHHRLRQFRLIGLAGAVVLVVLAVAGLVGVALAVAAILVPIIFVLYLRDAEVYRREPLRVLALTFGGGIVIGAVLTLLLDAFASPAAGEEAGLLQVMAAAVIVPVVAEALKPLPVLGLRRHFAQTVDGLTFGVAAGMGYALAETVVNFAGVITGPLRQDASQWILTVVTAGVLTPLLQGACTGAVCAAWWRLQRRDGRRRLAILTIVTAVAAHLAYSAGSQLLLGLGAPAWTLVVWQIVVVLGIVYELRLLLHDSLLDEARGMGLHSRMCAHCGHDIEAAGFCPECGLALAASPRRTHHAAAGSR